MIIHLQYGCPITKKFDSSIHKKTMAIAGQLIKLEGVHRIFVRVDSIVMETPTVTPDKWIKLGAIWHEATIKQFDHRLRAIIDAGKSPSWDTAIEQERVAAELYYEELCDVLQTDDLFQGEGMLAFDKLPQYIREGEILKHDPLVSENL